MTIELIREMYRDTTSLDHDLSLPANFSIFVDIQKLVKDKLV